MIARIWKGAVRKEDGDAYADYMQETGVAAVYGVLLTALSAAAFLLWCREREMR